MNKAIVTALAILASTAALASDLPSKNTPVPPTFTQVSQNGYIGVNAGGDTGSARAYTGGLVIGADASQYLTVEGAYDYWRPNTPVSRDTRNQVGINLLPKYRILNTPISIYGLVGAGYSWNNESKSGYIYSYGGGLKYDVAKNIELDARYRRVNFFDTTAPRDENRITGGVNYKF